MIEALHLGAPASLMQAAVEARNISSGKELRGEMAAAFGGPERLKHDRLPDRAAMLEALEGAMIGAKVCAYAQGFEVLRRASDAFDWNLDLAAIARVWRAGCIIRSVLLDDISEAFEKDQSQQLQFAPKFQALLQDNSANLQKVCAEAVEAGIEAPALLAALSYHNAGRTERSTANMIQGLRDRFGAHTFERVDDPGTKVNGPWHD